MSVSSSVSGRLASALAIPLLLLLLAASTQDAWLRLMWGFVLLGAWALIALAWLAAGIYCATRGDWRRACTAALVPTIVLIVSFNLPRFINGCEYLGNRVHFAAALPYYELVIAKLPRDGHRLAVFDWGDASMMGRSDYGVVYDESGEVALPRYKRSAAWVTKAAKTELGCVHVRSKSPQTWLNYVRAVPLWSHYFFATFCDENLWGSPG